MEVRATAKFVRVQPRKVRIVADEVRGKDANHTVSLLRYHPSKSARILRKVLVSAMANAQENHGLSADSLRIAEIRVDEGPKLKRLRARAQGRGNRILKKMVRPHGTKAKPRPTFAAPTSKAAAKKKKAVDEPVAQAEAIAEDTKPVEATEPTVEETKPAEPEEPAAEEVAAPEQAEDAAETKGAE
jgi:large subunit ribosomal protein L22